MSGSASVAVDEDELYLPACGLWQGQPQMIGAWSRVPPGGHPARPIVDKTARYLAAVEYAHQKAMLDDGDWRRRRPRSQFQAAFDEAARVVEDDIAFTTERALPELVEAAVRSGHRAIRSPMVTPP